jgi:SAM-dependent methyltransferase
MTDLAPFLTLQDLIMGKWLAQAVGVAAKLGVADLLKDGPRSCEELADATQSNPTALYRVLRALASVGVFAEGDDGRFMLTPSAEFLRSDIPRSLRAVATLGVEEWTWRPWGDLLGCVRSGGPAFERTFGMPAFDYLAKHPDAAAVFDEAMTGWSMQNSAAVAAAYDFSGIGTLMDVGGGHGYLLATILAANPSLKGVLYETPAVCEGARARLAAEGLADRCRVVEGDFFAEAPGGADACILKSVIHDWDDARATNVLRNCRRALGPGGRVLLAEMVVPPGNDPHPAKLIDLEMLVMVGGHERSEAQFRDLLAGAGFRLSRIVSTTSPTCVIEGLPAE